MVIVLDGMRITDIAAHLRTLEVQIEAKRRELSALEDRRGLILSLQAAYAKQESTMRKNGSK